MKLKGPVDNFQRPVPLFAIGGDGGGGGAGAAGGGLGSIPTANRIVTAQIKIKKKRAPPTVRKNFPETWLWTEKVVR